MSVVFACADPQVPGGLILPSASEELLRLLEGMPPGTLVCTTSSTGPGGVQLRRYLRAGIRPDVRMVHLSLRPTVIPVVASVLRVGGFPPGTLTALAAGVTAACPTVAVVDSVHQLEDPAPSVVQHAFSRIPGIRFGLDTRGLDDGGRGDKGGVVRMNWTPSVWDRKDSAVVVTASADDPTSERWRRDLEQVNPARQFFRTGSVERPFRGARRWAEATAVPATFDELAQHLRTTVRVVPCSWCGNVVSAPVCPFCGITPVSPSQVSQTSPVVAAAPPGAAMSSAWTQLMSHGDPAHSIGSAVR